MIKEIKFLPETKLSKELNNIVTKHLSFNKTITLFMRGKYSDITNLGFSSDKTENNIMRHFVLMKKKDSKGLERIYHQLSGDIRDKIMGIVILISVYHQTNNQNKYIEMFKVLMNVFIFFNFLGVFDPRIQKG